MAAQVVQEQKVPGQGAHGVHLVAQQGYVPGGQSVPGGGHGGHVVEHVALGLFRGSEVGDHLGRLHDHLAQQQHAGADDLAHHAHHAHQGVDLGEVAAGGAQLLPDVGDRVQTDHINASVGEVQKVFRHVVEDHGVGVVQVPLVGIEVGHDHLLAVIQPGKAAGGSSGEHLGDRLLKFTGNIPVVVEEVALPVARLSGTGLAGPLVVLTGVVHHKVQAQADVLLPAGVGQRLQVLHGPQLGLDPAEVGHGVAAVAAALGALQQGHQVQIVDAALLNVRQFLFHTLQGAGKGVGVEHHAQQIPAAVPVGIVFPALVLQSQGVLALGPAAAEHLDKVVKGGHIAVVELAVEPLELVIAAVQTALEGVGVGMDGSGLLGLRLFGLFDGLLSLGLLNRFDDLFGLGKNRCRLLRRSFRRLDRSGLDGLLLDFCGGELAHRDGDGGDLQPAVPLVSLADTPGAGGDDAPILKPVHIKGLLTEFPPGWAWRGWLRCGSRSPKRRGWQRPGSPPAPGWSGPPRACRPGRPGG